MNIFLGLSIPLINFFLIKNFKVVSIFFLMRLFSAYSNRKKIISGWFLISYIFYLPELITGPHRNISDWNLPSFNTQKINITTLSFIFFYVNIILSSGLFYSFFINKTNFLIFKALITHLSLYFQFVSACKIINLINECFGQKPIINFNSPLLALSINDFWNRWHITLGNFARQFISQPISFFLRKKGLRNSFAYILSTLIAFVFIGLWHKFSLSYFSFGIYFAFFVLFEKTILFKKIQNFVPTKINRIVFIIYCQFIVILGYTLVSSDLANVIIHP